VPADAGETATITDLASFDSNAALKPAKKKLSCDNEPSDEVFNFSRFCGIFPVFGSFLRQEIRTGPQAGDILSGWDFNSDALRRKPWRPHRRSFNMIF